MRNRITWENVTAPDFGEAIKGINIAGENISGAFQTAGTAIKDVGTNNNKRASSAAVAQAMGITDPKEWDAFMKAGGPASMGISPDRMTDEALAFFRDRGQALLDEDETGANIDLLGARTDEAVANTGLIGARTGLTEAQTTESFANTDRINNGIRLDNIASNISMAQEYDDNWSRDRQKRLDQQTDANNAATLKREADARSIVDKLVSSPDITDTDKFTSTVDKLNLPPLLEKEVLAQRDQIDPLILSATPEEIERAQAMPIFTDSVESLTGIRMASGMKYAGDKMLQYYKQGTEGNKGEDGLNSLVQRIVQGQDKAEASQWSGTIVNMHERLMSETGLPGNVVTGVMAESLKGGMIPGWTLGKLVVNEESARQVLRSLGEPEEVTRLEDRRVEEAVNNREIDAAQKKLERATLKLAKAERLNDNRGIQEANQELMGARTEVLRLSKLWQPKVNTTPNPGPGGSQTPTINTTGNAYLPPSMR